MNLPTYYSAREYAKKTGLGVEEVKHMVKRGFLKGDVTEGGHYKIEVWENSIPIEQYQELLKENLELKTKLDTIRSLV